MLIGEVKGANQPDALILGSGKTVADDDGASDEGVHSRFEDLRSAPTPGGRARWLGKLNWPHRFDFELIQNDSHARLSLRI